MSIRVAIAGGNGRMGRTLIELIAASDELVLTAVTLAPEESVPQPSPAAEALYTHDIDAALEAADVLVDFTTPATTGQHGAACASAGVSWVLGTTGLDEAQQAAVAAAAQKVAICQSANFSTGVNLMLRLVELASRASDSDTDLEVIEAHHRHKVDAPSGTALAIGKAMAAGRDVQLDEQAVMSREGITGARVNGTIGFATIRGGDIVGDHTALFASEGERLEITHRAGTRQAFARGACRAAVWLAGKGAGLYDMQDVLQLRE
ncbi:4-hydroxy-tetrahydrodipicolinate reductase [Congregibacter litoralis]|uniref:4-hydroxy-tetrahydrodipicolinate reductase n=1 Tax=Congregibacter litoralis KT71 TaxID=314285 RepID=A4A5R2_9GAMM|nr:4-hydroxy-tetrahydrodipicolinate reductase [Congregibacter litoralis]EAQ98359.1 dihydrodipicolinate reductase [Congregibacter litoralis KT71]